MAAPVAARALPTLDIYLYWDHSLDADPANQWLRGLLLPSELRAKLGESTVPDPDPNTAL